MDRVNRWLGGTLSEAPNPKVGPPTLGWGGGRYRILGVPRFANLKDVLFQDCDKLVSLSVRGGGVPIGHSQIKFPKLSMFRLLPEPDNPIIS